MSKIKICGLTREEDIRYVNECLPDYIGFVFAESRRQVDRKRADRMREKLDGRICRWECLSMNPLILWLNC